MEQPILEDNAFSESKAAAIGPHLRLTQEDDLVFLSCGKDIASKWIFVENVGTCALRYQWSCRNVRHPACSESLRQPKEHDSNSLHDFNKLDLILCLSLTYPVYGYITLTAFCMNVRLYNISNSFYVDSQEGVILPEESRWFRCVKGCFGAYE